MRGLCRLVTRHYWRVTCEGIEHVPAAGPLIVVSNHPSYLDPWFVGTELALRRRSGRRWITWLAWAESFDWPVLGQIVRVMGSIPLDLDKPGSSSLRASLEVLRQGRALGIFWEGQRSQGYLMDPPRRGALRLALRTGAAVLPVSLCGVRRCYPVGGFPRPGRVRVVYHPPVFPAELPPGSAVEREQVLQRRVAEAIQSALRADGRPGRRGERVSQPLCYGAAVRAETGAGAR